MRYSKAIIAVALLFILFAFQHTVEAKGKGRSKSRSRSRSSGHRSSSSHSSHASHSASSNHHTSGSHHNAIAHETHSQSHTSHPTQSHWIFNTPLRATSHNQAHSSYPVPSYHTPPAHDAGTTYYPQAGVAPVQSYGNGFLSNIIAEIGHIPYSNFRYNHHPVVHHYNHNNNKDKEENKVIIINNGPAGSVESTPQAAVLRNDNQNLNPPIPAIVDASVYQNPGSQLDASSNTLTETNTKVTESVGLNTNLDTINNLQSGFGGADALKQSLFNHRPYHDGVVHDYIGNQTNNNDKGEEKIFIINNDNVESTPQAEVSRYVNQDLNSQIPVIIDETVVNGNVHTSNLLLDTSSNTLTETYTKAPELVGLYTSPDTTNNSQSEGVGCLPIWINDTDPQNSSNVIEMEKVGCYLVPTEELQASETLSNTTIQQLPAGGPVIGNDQSHFSPPEILSSTDEMDKQVVLSSGIKPNYEPLNSIQTAKSTRTTSNQTASSTETVPQKGSSAGEPIISGGVILSLLLFCINF